MSEPLGPARGCINGIIVSIVLWAIIVVVVLWLIG